MHLKLKNYSGLIKLTHLTDFSTAHLTTQGYYSLSYKRREKKKIILKQILTIWRQFHPPKSLHNNVTHYFKIAWIWPTQDNCVISTPEPEAHAETPLPPSDEFVQRGEGVLRADI